MVILWGVAGLLAGAGVHAANRWLARREGLQPSPPRWHLPGSVLSAGALCGLLAWQLGFGADLLVRSVWVAVLLQVAFFDLEHQLVLDRVLLPAGAAAIVCSVLLPGADPGWQPALVAGAGAGAVFALLAVAGRFVFRAEVMGMGDVKLALFMGAMLGKTVAVALMVGMLSALVPSVVLLARYGPKKARKMKIPFAPFLAVGSLTALFAGEPLLDAYLGLFGA
jgi:leader peptidase (prepilin peptidase)/N-methyltransferase